MAPVTSSYCLAFLTAPPTWRGRPLTGKSLELLAALAAGQDRVSDGALIKALWSENVPARPLRATQHSQRAIC